MFKLTLLLLAGVLVLGVLGVGLVVVLANLVRFWLTGRKPAVFATFSRFRQTANTVRTGNWRGHGGSAMASSADIVDVQAHEVRPILPSTSPPKATE